jgi:hypothetical protein
MTTAEISFKLWPTMSSQSYYRAGIGPSEIRSETTTEIFEKFCSELCSQLFSDINSFESTLFDEDSTTLPTSSDDPLRYDQWQEWAARARAEKRRQTADLLDDNEDLHVEHFMQLPPKQDASRSRKRSKQFQTTPNGTSRKGESKPSSQPSSIITY